VATVADCGIIAAALVALSLECIDDLEAEESSNSFSKKLNNSSETVASDRA